MMTGSIQKNCWTYGELLGTFARVWLVRLANSKPEDESRVYALKVLRKVDGTRDIWSFLYCCNICR